jgi:hypothetical protein
VNPADCAIPVGCTPDPVPFIDVSLAFFGMDDDDKFPAGAGDNDKWFPDSWPVISTGKARFDTHPPGKV